MRVSRGNNFLIVACILGVASMFSRGIPWWAWGAAFLILILEAEFLSRSLAGKSSSGQKVLGWRLIAVAVVAAVFLMVSLFLLDFTGIF